MKDGSRSPVERYEDWSKLSAELVEEARRYFPGGDTRISAHFPPYPLFIERGEGCRLFDADGHELIDFMNNFTSLIHGHAHAPTVAAVEEQIRRGSAYAAPRLTSCTKRPSRRRERRPFRRRWRRSRR